MCDYLPLIRANWCIAGFGLFVLETKDLKTLHLTASAERSETY